MNYHDFFIAIYTHSCKTYCDERFYSHLFNTDIGDAPVHIVDNSLEPHYYARLKAIIKNIVPYRENLTIEHLEIKRDNQATQFVRNVYESVNYLRNIFLATDCKYFVTLETDVLPPHNWLHLFMGVIDELDLIGGIYYEGWHGQDMFDDPTIIRRTHHVLSGCTLYKREIIEKIPFKWVQTQPNAFPDAHISYSAYHSGFRTADYSAIKCHHIDKNEGKSDIKDRGHGEIN